MTFGTPTGSAHPAGGERGAARAAGADQPADVAARLHEVRERERHRGHRAAAIAAEDRGLAVGMVTRNLARMHARRRRLARGREVDGDDAQAAALELLAQEL